MKRACFAAARGSELHAANKVKGIRAAVCTNEFCAEMTRRHNDANILAMGGRVIDEKATAVKLADIFLNTPFEGGRHLERIQQVAAIENGEKIVGGVEKWKTRYLSWTILSFSTSLRSSGARIPDQGISGAGQRNRYADVL